MDNWNRWFAEKQLKELGFAASKATTFRKVSQSRFPKPRHHGPKIKRWWGPVLQIYSKALAAGNSEKEATRIAEQFAARLLDPEETTEAA